MNAYFHDEDLGEDFIETSKAFIFRYIHLSNLAYNKVFREITLFLG